MALARLTPYVCGCGKVASATPRIAGGYYGDMTVAGVTNFQAREGLKQTGAVHETTWARLKAAASNLPAPTPTPTKAPTPTPTTTPPKNTANLDRRCLTGRVICINKSANRIYWVINGQVQNDWSIRHGRPGLDTREGTFSVYQKDVKSWSYLYNVWMPYSMYFSGGQAIHYSEEFATYGYSRGGSHGCVNMRDYAGIEWLFSQVRLGDKVVVHR